MKEIFLVKLGGSLITDKERPQTARPEVISRLAREIAAARKEPGVSLLLGHGSGSFGHPAALEHGLRGNLETDAQRAGASVTQVHAARLHRQVVEALHEAGALPFSIAPSSCLQTDQGKIAEMDTAPFVHALDLGLTPTTYGDVATDRSWGAAVVSTEKVLLELVQRLVSHWPGSQQQTNQGLRPLRAFWLGETDGILDPQGRTVPSVTASNLDQVRDAIGVTRGTDVTGGMALRLETAWRLAHLGVSSQIFDGRTPGSLERALGGGSVGGTQILATG